MFVIHSYTAEDAIEDGLHVRLAANLTCTTNLACTLASDEDSPSGFSLARLWDALFQKVSAYYAGTYYDEGATEYPDECDSGLACYLIDGHKVWIMPTYPGSTSVIAMLPEDY